MLLLKCIDNAKFYTLLFDESLNKATQQKQLDIHIHFWNPDKNIVETRYLTSAFLGHSVADDLLACFYASVKNVDLKKLLQISMDGPAVNWKFYNNIQEDLLKEHGVQCNAIGSCGLHILNNAFYKGESETEWLIGSILSSIFYLFKDSPTRKEDFINQSTENKLPLKFCNHRWLENAPAAERAILLWNDLKSYVKNVGKFRKVKCKSFLTLQEAIKDKLILVKLNFFLNVSELVSPFLKLYQADRPLLPFFAADIQDLVLHSVQLYNILKPESIENLNSLEKLCHFNFCDEKNYVSLTKISVGFKGDQILKQLASKVISDRDHINIKKDCRKFITKMLETLLEKCPINYSVVRNVACINPKLMSENKSKCVLKMRNILNYLSKKKKIEEKDCDKIKLQFASCID
nr:uncharacterized protein LOC122268951 [Parasteatoda tepidariorum]